MNGPLCAATTRRIQVHCPQENCGRFRAPHVTAKHDERLQAGGFECSQFQRPIANSLVLRKNDPVVGSDGVQPDGVLGVLIEMLVMSFAAIARAAESVR